MSNQDKSQNPPASNGFTGPIERGWQEWLSQNREKMQITPTGELAFKYVYYVAAVTVYNDIMNSLRADTRMTMFKMVLDTMKREFDMYFMSNQSRH